MSRLTTSSLSAIAISALALTACGTDASGHASSTAPAAKKLAPASGVTAGRASTTVAPTAAGRLATLPRRKFTSVLLTSAQIAAFTPAMVRGDLAEGDDPDKLTGKGGTCPALAGFMGRGGVLGGAKSNAVALGYSNLATTYIGPPASKTSRKFRTITEMIQVSPSRDAAAYLRLYRAAAADCSTPLVDRYGSRTSVTPLPDPRNLGPEAMAIQINFGDKNFDATTTLEMTASGQNAMGIATTGYSAKQRAAISAQAWKNVVTRK